MDDRGRGGYSGDRFGAPAGRELPMRDLPPRDRSRSRDRFREERPAPRDEYRREERAAPAAVREELPARDSFRARADDLPVREERPSMDEREREHHHHERESGRGEPALGDLPPQ